MNLKELENSYNKIAENWNSDMSKSEYGITIVNRAIKYCSKKETALDVGCGSGGRIIKKMLANGFKIKAVDISEKMLEIAKTIHPNVNFEKADITNWKTDKKFDFIIAWDSIFHLPLKSQKPVIKKLCDLLNPKGILLYSLGDSIGEHIDIWHNEKFCYSSIGIEENLKIISNSNCECRHLELDQFPNNHAFIIVRKNSE